MTRLFRPRFRGIAYGGVSPGVDTAVPPDLPLGAPTLSFILSPVFFYRTLSGITVEGQRFDSLAPRRHSHLRPLLVRLVLHLHHPCRPFVLRRPRRIARLANCW